VTTNPSESQGDAVEAEVVEPDPLADYAASVARAVGAGAHSAEHGTIKMYVEPEAWVETLTIARDELDLGFFSWLSAVDWANEVEVGDGPDEEVTERYEVLCAVGDLTDGNLVIFSTNLDREAPAVDSLVQVYPGAAWHERESHEMFGIDFPGNPDLSNLYLPDGFVGHPLRKEYPLLSREVKPWPGKVDVEDMPPSTENPEA